MFKPMIFGFRNILPNLRLCSSFFFKRCSRRICATPAVCTSCFPFRNKFSQMLLVLFVSAISSYNFFTAFTLQRDVVSSGIALQRRAVFSYL